MHIVPECSHQPRFYKVSQGSVNVVVWASERTIKHISPLCQRLKQIINYQIRVHVESRIEIGGGKLTEINFALQPKIAKPLSVNRYRTKQKFFE